MFPEEETLSIDTPSRKTFVSCKFQRPCWKTIRAPLARKHKIYLPYVCSFQSEGDIDKCSHYWNFRKEEEEMNARGSVENDLSTTGVVRDDI